MIVISCRETARLLSRSREESLNGYRRLSLAVHLAICTNCRTYSSQLRWLDRALYSAYRDAVPGLEDPARLRIAKVLAQLERGAD